VSCSNTLSTNGYQERRQRWARIQPPQVLGGDRRPLALARQDDRLYAREDFTRPVARDRRASTPLERLQEAEQFHALVECQLVCLIDPQALGELGRKSHTSRCRQIADSHRSQSCRG